MTVLVLAGTTEASALVDRLAARRIDVVASLAGRTSSPRPLACPVRTGGFGGVDGLVGELRSRRVRALVDATHPFAERMPQHALEAATICRVPHLRLVRAPWPSRAGWVEVGTVADAAARVQGRTLLTLGRQELDAFRTVGVPLVVRSVDVPPAGPWQAVLGRGPFAFDDEVALLRDHRIETLVTRNSGGSTAKLDAADTLGVRVVVISRPRAVDAPTVVDVDAAVEWVLSRS